MASTLVDLVKINVLNTGTGPFMLGSAADGFRGVEVLINGQQYSYSVQQGGNYEYGRGVYLEETGQLARGVIASSLGGTAISLSPNAQIALVVLAEDLMDIAQGQAAIDAGAAAGAAAAEAVMGTKLDGSGVAALSDILGVLSVINGAAVQATEAIGAHDFVNVYNSSGATRVRKAIANDPTKFANGFAVAAISNGSSGIIVFSGINLGIPVLTPASEVWLSDTTAGTFATSPPSAEGSIIQPLGPALAGFGVVFTPRERILL